MSKFIGTTTKINGSLFVNLFREDNSYAFSLSAVEAADYFISYPGEGNEDHLSLPPVVRYNSYNLIYISTPDGMHVAMVTNNRLIVTVHGREVHHINLADYPHCDELSINLYQEVDAYIRVLNYKYQS